MTGMTAYREIAGIEVDELLHAFVEEEALPGTGTHPAEFWQGFAGLLRDLTPENERLLARRDELQLQIDERNEQLGGHPPAPAEEEEFLRRIGYLEPAPPPFR